MLRSRLGIVPCPHTGDRRGLDTNDDPALKPAWGTLDAIHRTGTVPDVIEDEGGVRMEAVMRVLGREPAELVDKVRRIMAVE